MPGAWEKGEQQMKLTREQILERRTRRKEERKRRRAEQQHRQGEREASPHLVVRGSFAERSSPDTPPRAAPGEAAVRRAILASEGPPARPRASIWVIPDTRQWLGSDDGSSLLKRHGAHV